MQNVAFFFHRYFSLLFCVKKLCFTTRNLTCRFFTYDRKNTAILLIVKKTNKEKKPKWFFMGFIILQLEKGSRTQTGI